MLALADAFAAALPLRGDHLGALLRSRAKGGNRVARRGVSKALREKGRQCTGRGARRAGRRENRSNGRRASIQAWG
eukprot:2665495-Pyramimonas_sp.AAC.1